ncbi:unnamed protein product [Rotaria socialis]|uniref:DUF8206 domain-containing protein n=1 Tax=Rotaria socialis TaxID=392032 RepID=A0A820Y526_9BILA|nr:unnamed protein product [Rotaria socialis]CAF4540948.1 unnamed protein product [Rotaria socialis]
MARRNESSTIKANRYCRPEDEINILLMGQTGVGKSTFINGLANYLCKDTLDEAVNNRMQAIIPSSFNFTHSNTFEQKMIIIGEENEHEKFSVLGQSCTQQCRSFILPVGNRNLRIIDTPGVADTRGLEQDAKNFHEILTYISQYEHLNAICILLKPNEERLTILFKFCIQELLRHIHLSANENIIFIFTNIRSTMFAPGSTSHILKVLLDQYKTNYQVDVPFKRNNTFLLDNEAFRFLAVRQNGIQLSDEQTASYQKSWDYTIKEYSRLVGYIATRSMHGILDTLSLNEAEQVVRKLTRPIAETAKLIEQNIQLAKQHKDKVLKNPQLASKGIPQNDAAIVKLSHPRTVCRGEKCCRVVNINNEQKTEYTSKCHDKCYLKGVVQEAVNDIRISHCEVIDVMTGNCLTCGCHWEKHHHITYEYQTNLTHLNENASLSDIDKYITSLRNKQEQIKDVYKKLAKFLHANAILPLNEDILEYLQQFIHEEKMKNNAGARNADVIDALQKMVDDHKKEMELFKETIKNGRDRPNAKDVLQPAEIFPLVGTLYHLPINGKKIREQVDGLKLSQDNIKRDREIYLELPAQANSSKVMLAFKTAIPPRERF